MIKVRSADLDVVGAVNTAELDPTTRIHLNVDLLGEISPSEARSWRNDTRDELLDEGIRCWREQRRKPVVR